jgi:hypothetical protein
VGRPLFLYECSGKAGERSVDDVIMKRAQLMAVKKQRGDDEGYIGGKEGDIKVQAVKTLNYSKRPGGMTLKDLKHPFAETQAINSYSECY